MPSKEIKELRQSGKLEEAYLMAKSEFDTAPDNIWAKRNISWVYFEYLKQNIEIEGTEKFIHTLEQIKALQLGEDEKLLFENVAWKVGTKVFALIPKESVPIETETRYFNEINAIYHLIKEIPFTKPSEGCSFMFKAFHKHFKEDNRYLEFANWWGFENFREEDYQKEKLPNGKDMMAVVEQAYIAYAKHLLPKTNFNGEIIFDRIRAEEFLPKLSALSEAHQEFQYPPYFMAKLLLALGDRTNMLSALIPFAKKKKNEFWVWEIFAEGFPNDADKIFACYCKGLSCNNPEEMLVGLRQKLAAMFIIRKEFNEARTEIDRILKVKEDKQQRIAGQLAQWKESDWYLQAIAKPSNMDVYRRYLEQAEEILFYDEPEQFVVIDFINSEKRMVNFVKDQNLHGFFKYGNQLKEPKIGDILRVRFEKNQGDNFYKVLTVKKADQNQQCSAIKGFNGKLSIGANAAFGFVEDIFIEPKMVSQFNLKDGQEIEGKAILSFNKKKESWGWKGIVVMQ